jgi:hypothetical protein
MKKIMVIALAFATSIAFAQQSRDCRPQEFFSSERVKNNLANEYSVLSIITRDNYEEMKKALSASVPGYFGGDYDEFSKKREEFFSYFEASSSFSSSSEFYRHSLSKEGAQAYAECVGGKQNKLFVAYIFNDDPKSGSRVSIGFSTRVGGNTTVDWEVRGENPVKGFPRKGKLTPNSSDGTQFAYDRRKDFQVQVRAVDKKTGQIWSEWLTLPRYRIFNSVTDFDDSDRIIVGCKAGCQGNSAGCQILENGEKLAPSGWTYEVPSIAFVGSYSPWRYSLRAMNMDPWSAATDSLGRVIRISSNIRSCEGQNGDTQGYRIDTYAVRRTRDRIVEDIEAKIVVDTNGSVPNDLGKNPKLPPLPWADIPGDAAK